MSRRAVPIVALVLVLGQAVLALGYLVMESRRDAPATFAWEPLDEVAPALQVQHGSRAVRPPEEVHLVHFWATWCAPCVAELPSLMAAAEAEGVPLLAVTDEPWPTVLAWFDGTVPSAVVRDATGEASAAWQVQVLPDTFVVDGGRITARMGGTRHWSSRDARRFLDEVRP
jgi:hypothetical protein